MKIESRNQELAILAAFDYGLGALGNMGKNKNETKMGSKQKWGLDPCMQVNELYYDNVECGAKLN